MILTTDQLPVTVVVSCQFSIVSEIFLFRSSTFCFSAVVTMRICEASASAPSNDWGISTTDRDDGSDTALERKDRKVTQNVQS